MSDSPVSRPKRNSSFASFYIDEDDFEDAPSTSNNSRKMAKEEVFVISEKYENVESESESDYSDDAPIETFEPKVSAKSSNKSTKKQATTNKKTNSSKEKPKSNTIKSITKSSSKSIKKDEEDDFEVIVEDEDDVESEFENELKNEKNSEDENFNKKNVPLKSKKTALNKSKSFCQSKSVKMTSVPNRPSIVSSRPKLPSSFEKVKIPGQQNGPRRVGLSKSAPIRPLSPVKVKKFS